MSAPPHPVHPPLSELVGLEAAVQGLSLGARQKPHSVLAGLHASRLRGRGLDFSELRRYARATTCGNWTRAPRYATASPTCAPTPRNGTGPR